MADDYKVLVVKIEKVEKHPNADRLDMVHVRGWQCVTQRGTLKAGGLAVYIPIDSVLPPHLEAAIFPPGSKVKLSKSRVVTIKLRGVISQGMALSIESIRDFLPDQFEEGFDATEGLGITHYEPPAAPASMRGRQVSKKNPFFPVYNKMSHFKNYRDLFIEGEDVVVTEKIHGTNFRAGWVPMIADTVWKKAKRFFGHLPEWEFVVGSHQVQINTAKSIRPNWKGFYPTNVYVEVVKKYDLKSKIPLGHIIYGEIYGSGIQKGYGYGLADGEHALMIFDVLKSPVPSDARQVYLPWQSVQNLAQYLNVPTVPVIYRGQYSKALIPRWEQGVSLVSAAQAHREGCVIKPELEQETWIGRKILRSINPEYLLKSESDFH